NAVASHPQSAFYPGVHAHPGTLLDVLPFQLGKDGENADHGLAIGGGGVKVFVDGDEVAVIGGEHIFQQKQGVFLGTAETVQLVDHHHGYFSHGDVPHETPQFRAVNVGAAPAAVDIQFGVFIVFDFAPGFQFFGLGFYGVAFFKLGVRGNTDVKGG